MKLIKPIVAGKLLAVDVKAKATDDYNDWLQKNLGKTVWSSCVSWYVLRQHSASQLLTFWFLVGTINRAARMSVSRLS